MKNRLIFILIIIISFLINERLSDAVCDAETLIRELSEDVAYGGKLNCNLKQKSKPSNKEESKEEEDKRIKATWNSDCAFKANYDWFSIAKENYALTSLLIDEDGNTVEAPLEDQADICQLIRAMVNSNLFDGISIDKIIPEDAFETIRCPGPENIREYQICAATGGESPQRELWLILLSPSVLTINEDGASKPTFKYDSKSEDKLRTRKAVTANSDNKP